MSENISDIKKPIILVGMMGCGKSHVGKAIARRLTLPFFDSDALIEADQETVISDIFEQKGEVFFRQLEADKIASLMLEGACVISTGGGAVTTRETLMKIRQDSVSVWIKASSNKIYERIKHDTTRPLLQCDNPKQRIQEILDTRKELYAQANIHIDNSRDNPNSTVDEIVQALHRFL